MLGFPRSWDRTILKICLAEFSPPIRILDISYQQRIRLCLCLFPARRAHSGMARESHHVEFIAARAFEIQEPVFEIIATHELVYRLDQTRSQQPVCILFLEFREVTVEAQGGASLVHGDIMKNSDCNSELHAKFISLLFDGFFARA